MRRPVSGRGTAPSLTEQQTNHAHRKFRPSPTTTGMASPFPSRRPVGYQHIPRAGRRGDGGLARFLRPSLGVTAYRRRPSCSGGQGEPRHRQAQLDGHPVAAGGRGWSGVAANPACGAGTGRRCNEANPDLPPAGQRPAIAVAPKAAVAVSLATLGMVYPADAASASVRPPGTSPPFSQRKTTHWSGPNCAGASPADPVSDNVNAQSPGPALRS